MKHLLISVITSALAFASALLSVYGVISISDFIVLNIPMFGYSFWLSFHPEVSINITKNHMKAYIVASIITAILSVWYLYMVFNTEQYITLIIYGVISIPIVFLSMYIAAKSTRYTLDLV